MVLQGIPLVMHHECSKCGSSDAATTYRHPTENYEYVKCYSCDASYSPEDTTDSKKRSATYMSTTGTLKQGTTPKELRGLSENTLRTYGIQQTEHDTVIFPYYDLQGNLRAQKLREDPRSRKMAWRFTPGYTASDVTFFGISPKTPKKGKYITVTEGEFDAPSVFQMLGSKWPCISLKNGASDTKITKEELEFLNGYENIVLCFDNDDQGRKAVEKFSEHFESGKIKVVPKDLKDANEYLEAGKDQIYKDLWFRARPFSPAQIVYGKETLDIFETEVPKPIAHWPWESMNKKLTGIREGELILVMSGTGVGKTAFMKTVAKHLYETTDEKIGLMCLEEPLRLTVYDLVSMSLGRNLRRPEILDTVDPKERKRAWLSLFNNDRWVFWDHFGDSTIDNVVKNVRFMVSSFGAKFVIVDNVTMITGTHIEDERKALDEITARLATVCSRLGVTVFLVCHLRRVSQGLSHEEGGQASLSQARGSGGLGNFTWVGIGLERDTQNEDSFIKNITKIRCLKDRWLGETGLVCMVYWNSETSQLTEITEDDILFHKEQKKHHVKEIRDQVKELAEKHEDSKDT